MKKKVLIIGGGVAGLTAAINLRKNNHEVWVLERNDRPLKKLLLTGNGKCNYWNQDQAITHYHSTTEELLPELITSTRQQAVLDFFDSIGIIPRIKNGYYYPFSNQASSMVESLYLSAIDQGVNMLTNLFVEDVIVQDNQFIVNPMKEKITGDSLIVATGSMAYPKTGSDGMGYKIAKSFGHHIVPVMPALVQLKMKESDLKDWKGIRCEARLESLVNGKVIQEESGELQLTEYGISGICTLNISSKLARSLAARDKVEVAIHFLPWLSTKQEVETYLENRACLFPSRTLEELLETILPYKLVHVLFNHYKVDFKKKWHTLTQQEKDTVSRFLFCHVVEIVGTNSFDQSQVCSGGVPLTEVHLETLESKYQKNLYFAGEVLDVNGDCGGYNLGFAFLSGILAGKKVGNDQ